MFEEIKNNEHIILSDFVGRAIWILDYIQHKIASFYKLTHIAKCDGICQ